MRTLIAWIQMLPALLEMVSQVERFLPPGTGAQKLALVIGLLRAIYETTESIQRDFPWEKLVNTVTRAIKTAVDVFNALGVFKHGGASAPADPS